MRDDFNVNAANALADRAKVASVICSWKDAVIKAKLFPQIAGKL